MNPPAPGDEDAGLGGVVVERHVSRRVGVRPTRANAVPEGSPGAPRRRSGSVPGRSRPRSAARRRRSGATAGAAPWPAGTPIPGPHAGSSAAPGPRARRGSRRRRPTDRHTAPVAGACAATHRSWRGHPSPTSTIRAPESRICPTNAWSSSGGERPERGRDGRATTSSPGAFWGSRRRSASSTAGVEP